MSPGQAVREALASVRSQRVPSVMIALLAAVMCLTTILTVGRSVSAEQQVAARLDSAGSRVLVVRDARNAGVIQAAAVPVVSHLSTVERAVGLTVPVDVTNGVVGEGGFKVAAWQVIGELPGVVDLTAGRWPRAGEALVSDTGRLRLGLADGIGWVAAGTDQFPVVGTYRARAPFEDLAAGVVVAAAPGTPPASLHVIARRADEARASETLVLRVLAPPSQDAVTIESPVGLAEIQRQVGDDVGSFSRSLLFGVLGAGALLIGIVVLADVLIRRKDLGRRRALGATRSLIVALVVLRTLAPALLGALLGAIAGQWLTTTWHVQPTLAFAAATAVLATLTAAVSAVLPAAFAAQRDPVAVLRTP